MFTKCLQNVYWFYKSFHLIFYVYLAEYLRIARVNYEIKGDCFCWRFPLAQFLSILITWAIMTVLVCGKRFFDGGRPSCFHVREYSFELLALKTLHEDMRGRHYQLNLCRTMTRSVMIPFSRSYKIVKPTLELWLLCTTVEALCYYHILLEQ